ncbi:MAG: HD domain-containing protein [Patescibacteria group bacterium]|nr:HD domain-containing protein [Patescibacteria group bacterium]
MLIAIPKEVVTIIKEFQKHKYPIYIVGGAVRDILMGKEVSDWDFTTSATPEEMLAFLPNSYYTNSFGTVGVPSETKDLKPFEITTFRTEHGGYSDHRRPNEVRWGKTLKEDLQRRDFTINALALEVNLDNQKRKDLLEVNLIDYFDGKKDLNEKIIKAVGEPHDRFSEDALRLVRAVRIASELGFNIEENTLEAIKKHSDLINKISKERIRDELIKIFSSPKPHKGIILLKETLLLEHILPEMTKTYGVEQKSPGRHHISDVWTHSLDSLKFVSEINKDPIVRFATLIHDIGKPQTFKVLPSGTITFYNHEVVGAIIARRIAERLRFSNEQKDKLVRLVRYHQFTVNENQTDSALRRFIRNVTPQLIPDMIDLRIGDRLGSGAKLTSWRLENFKKRLIEVQKQPFSLKDIKVTGHDVMEILNIPPGKKVGEVLNDIFKKVENKELENERDALVQYIKSLKTEA